MKYLLFANLLVAAFGQAPLRPPAVPLITHDPYFSVWSMSDQLAGSDTKHWTESVQPMAGVLRVDGKPYRFMGAQWRWAERVPAMRQVSREVTPTRTLYSFEADGIQLDLTFLTPALPDDLDTLSRPVTYLNFRVRATDGRAHQTQLYLDVAAHIAVNHPSDAVEVLPIRFGELEVLRMGSRSQAMLTKSGDDLRIDWGHFYLAAAPQAGLGLVRTNTRDRLSWLASGKLDSVREEVALSDRLVQHVAAVFDFGPVNSTPLTRQLLLAYDDLYSVEYFGRKLRPYWRRGRATAETLLTDALRNYAGLEERSRVFDASLTKRLVAAGGDKYAAIAILAHRQTLAAHKLVADVDGTPLYFSKENFSNGCIGTVDVTYPSAPFFLALSPQLLKAQLRFILDYASMPRWPFPYPPHDVGQYPLANGQVYGGGELTELRQMPVEESGNMILLAAALAKGENNTDFTRRYWPLLTKWAQYLRAKGLDPENQLSTDDFAGHLAHNTNLSLKAITALGAYAQMAQNIGETNSAREYGAVAKQMAADWVRMADAGDHFKLTFDGGKETWSQKYNLVWDRLLGLNLFPAEVARKEIAWYKSVQKKYGVPLDNRVTYTKLDWIVWSATMAENRADFEYLVAPVYQFLQESPSRVPMTDWYETQAGTKRGFQARSVVGGVFIQLLSVDWSRK